MNLIRALFPQWNFFDRIAYSFELKFKSERSEEWIQIVFDQVQVMTSVIFNPSCNLALAQVNVVEHFVRDLQEMKTQDKQEAENQVKDLTTYRMLESFVLNSPQTQDAKEIQFKIVAVNPESIIDLFTSDVIRAKES